LLEISSYRTVLWNAKSSLRAQDQRDWHRPAIKVSTQIKFIPATIDIRVSIFINREYVIQLVLRAGY